MGSNILCTEEILFSINLVKIQTSCNVILSFNTLHKLHKFHNNWPKIMHTDKHMNRKYVAISVCELETMSTTYFCKISVISQTFYMNRIQSNLFRYVLHALWLCVHFPTNVSYHVHAHVKDIHVGGVRRNSCYLLQVFSLTASRPLFHSLHFEWQFLMRIWGYNVLFMWWCRWMGFRPFRGDLHWVRSYDVMFMMKNISVHV